MKGRQSYLPFRYSLATFGANLLPMRSLLSLALFGLAFLVLSCGGSGVTEIRSGDGATLSPGHAAYVSFRYFKNAANVLVDSKNAKEPVAMEVQSEAPANTMVHYLNGLQVGDSVQFKIMAREFFTDANGVMSMPDGVNASDMITFQLRVDSMITQAEYTKREAEREQRLADAPRIKLQNQLYNTRVYYQEFMEMEGVRDRIKEEGKAIDAIIAQNGELAFKSENGVRMVIVEEELGDLLAPGDFVFVNYTGYLLDGTFFDTNIKEVARANDALDPNRRYGPLRFQLGTGQVIMGWDEAFKTLSVGTQVVLYVPSSLGYREQGSGDAIPPHATLKFEIEIVQAQKPF
ncbi:MAG TPA: hypothetical protein DCR93_12400 [Cytophagales bacterium]|nr:hypothetical protein [Cytophagales bacterium]